MYRTADDSNTGSGADAKLNEEEKRERGEKKKALPLEERVGSMKSSP